MDVPILATKLYIPPSSPNMILRPHLIERLNRGLHRKLTLISAPAGFGKTTLMSEWAAGFERGESEGRVAWLSLDEGDSDPVRFLTYLITAIRKVAPNMGDEVLGILHSTQQVSIELILTALLNEIATVPGNFVLVLDDYHLIDSKASDEALAYIIEHLPHQMRMVITTREDPQIPLARLRARDQLTELRAADLRFSPAEAAGFLQGMGIDLSPKDVESLEDRTEGWIAGLQLAALALQSLAQQGPLSMQGHPDISGFIQAFSGDHRYIMDYLVEEVLQRQPQTTRSFLLQTAILDQLTGSLCDAVTGQSDGSACLESLQRGNFFVVSLDDKRQWYRYHHLFAEVLLAHLKAEQRDLIAMLHRRASAWFEQHGSAGDAIRHALAAEDFAHAADLVEQVFPAMARTRQEATLLGWFKALPEALVRERPVLCNLYAGVLLQHGLLEDVDAWLRSAERGLAFTAKPAVVNEAEFHRLPGAIAIHRAGLALIVGNVADTIKHARQALHLALEDDFLVRGGAAGLLGLSLWTEGNLEEAQRIFSEGILWLQKAGHYSDAIGLTLAQADILIAQGRLQAAMHTYERVLQLAAARGTPALRGTADMLVGMSELYRERGDLTAAKEHLRKIKDLGEHVGLPQNRYRSRAALALIRAAEGDLAGALSLLEEAERLYAGDFSPNVRPVAAMKARVWAAQGRISEAFDWARSQGLSAADDLSFLREFEHITLVRILLVRYRSERTGRFIQEAVGLLERLLIAAEAGGRVRSAIEIRILLALAHHAQGNTIAALPHLQQALVLAEPEGCVRLFVNEGPPMAHLLGAAAVGERLPIYAGRLLAAFEPGQQVRRENEAPRSESPAMPQAPPAKNILVEPLSERELDVLRLFRTELSGPEIAQELVIALSTVRTHTKSIYSKLNVNNRRAAVKRADELHLI